MATLTEVHNLLDKYNINVDIEHPAAQHQLYSLCNQKYEVLDKYLSNCVFLKNKLDGVCSALTLSQVYSIIINTNHKLLENISAEFDSFAQETGLEDKAVKTIFKHISRDVLASTKKTDQEMVNIAEKFIVDINKAKELATSFKATLDEDIATKLYSNCTNRMQTFYASANPQQIKDLVAYMLNSNNINAKISTDDLIAISERCASFYSNATAEKIQSINQLLTQFVQFVYNKFEDMPNLDPIQKMQYQTALKSKDLRNILLTTPSIFTENPAVIGFNIELIQGQTPLGALLKKYQVKQPEDISVAPFKDIVLNFSPIDLQKLYTGNLSALTTSPAVLLESLVFADQTGKKIFGNNIQPSEYITPETFAQIQSIHKFATASGQENQQWSDNLQLLAKIVNKDKLKEYFLSSFKLATIPTDYIKQQIAITILSSESQEDLNNNFDRLLSKNFFWDDSKDKSKTKNTKDVPKTSFDVPKYRVGNIQPSRINFNVDMQQAQEFLAAAGYNEIIIDSWKTKQSTPKPNKTKGKNNQAENLDVALLSQFNDVLNLIREFNALLNTNLSNQSLMEMNKDLQRLFASIVMLDSNIHEASTATKGLLVNVKNNFNDLSARYNIIIGKRQAACKEEIKKLEKEYTELSENLEEQYKKYTSYKKNVPAILAKYNSLLKSQTETSEQINQLRTAQEQNRVERFDRIVKFGPRIQSLFGVISQAAMCELETALVEHNPAQHICLLEEDLLQANTDYVQNTLHINSIDHYDGEVFIALMQMRNSPELQYIYNSVSNELYKQGINLEQQLNHSQPELFHGDALSKQLIIDFLGEDYTPENFETVLYYNGILNSAWKQNNLIEAKIAATEKQLSQIKAQIEELNQIINSSHSTKNQWAVQKQTLEKLNAKKAAAEELLEELKHSKFSM